MGRAWPASVPLLDDRHSHYDSLGLIGGQLDVVGWPKAAIGHLHHPGLRVRGGDPRRRYFGSLSDGLGLLLAFLGSLRLGQVVQGLLYSLHPLPGRSLPSGSFPLVYSRVGMLPLLCQPFHLGPRRLQVRLQGLLPAKELAPALARTRIPSWATRSRVTAPAVVNEATIWVSNSSKAPDGPSKVRQHVVVDGLLLHTATGKHRALGTGGPAAGHCLSPPPWPTTTRPATPEGPFVERPGRSSVALIEP